MADIGIAGSDIDPNGLPQEPYRELYTGGIRVEGGVRIKVGSG